MRERHQRRAGKWPISGWAASLAMIVWVVVTGGAGAETADFTRQITFGDSLSDSGRYAALLPPGTGKFTTNPDPIWVEILARSLGLSADSVAIGGTDFAEGGARVFVQEPMLIGTRLNIRAQILNFLAGGGRFTSRDIVTIQGGGNDVLAYLGATATLNDVRLAAEELADLTQLVVTKGAGLVIVANVPLADIFNRPFEARLAANRTNALFLNVAQLYSEILANPSAFGFKNVVDPACTTPTSLICLPQDLVEPDANKTYLFADDVHPTGAGHAIIADMTLAALRAPSQIGQLSLVGHSQAQAVHDETAALYGTQRDAGTLQFLGGVSYGRFKIDDLRRHNGIDQDAVQIAFGFDYQITDKTGAGAIIEFSDGSGDFGRNSGGYNTSAVIGSLYYRGRAGPLHWGAQANVGRHGFDHISRLVRLGPLVRAHAGSTSGLSWGLGAEAGYDLVRHAWHAGPVAGLRYFHISLDGYDEGDTTSTSMTFSDQTYEAFTGYAGLELAAPKFSRIQPYGRVVYNFGIDTPRRRITVTPRNAPISLTTDAYTPDEDYLSFRAGTAISLKRNLALDLSAGGDALRGGLRRFDVLARLKLDL